MSDLHSYLITGDQANSEGGNKKMYNKIVIEHAHATKIEKEVKICATNLANKTKCMSTNARKWGKKKFEDIKYLPIAPFVEQILNTRD
jgi:hypothetical protein